MQSAAVRAEQGELAGAERVVEGSSEQRPGKWAGRAVTLSPHRRPDVEETVLPPDRRRILAGVRQAAGPVMARQVGEMPGSDVTQRAKREPLRGRRVRLVGRGWLRKRSDGRFTTRL
ncbi:hypothetical protein AB0E62_28670 [Streptomyces sp. NPDC038707]|uniref:hypothetical protein n=1 Tax=unclassified Streptomyces TaxID=2593676 RepID=UPI0034008A26